MSMSALEGKADDPRDGCGRRKKFDLCAKAAFTPAPRDKPLVSWESATTPGPTLQKSTLISFAFVFVSARTGFPLQLKACGKVALLGTP